MNQNEIMGMTYFLCFLLGIVCIGLMWWSDISSQKHIEKGWDEAWKGDKHDTTTTKGHEAGA